MGDDPPRRANGESNCNRTLTQLGISGGVLSDLRSQGPQISVARHCLGFVFRGDFWFCTFSSPARGRRFRRRLRRWRGRLSGWFWGWSRRFSRFWGWSRRLSGWFRGWSRRFSGRFWGWSSHSGCGFRGLRLIRRVLRGFERDRRPREQTGCKDDRCLFHWPYSF